MLSLNALTLPSNSMLFIKYFMLTCCLSLNLTLFAGLVNLHNKAQDFVLETKKINLQGFEGALNPSIIRWKGSLLLSFRIRDPLTQSTNQFGLIWLDEQFNPKGKAQIFNLTRVDGLPSFVQDPRLVSIDKELYVVYNNFVPLEVMENRRMFIAKLHFDYHHFYLEPSIPLLNFENNNEKRQEKNWVPFDYHGNMLLSYSLTPHRVLYPLLNAQSCVTIYNTEKQVYWPWGELRGGTPALKEGQEYLAFFHSCKSMATIHSNGENIPHYFMGAYTFQAEPPFALSKISPEPIVGKDFYSGPSYNTWKPLRVVFPGGYIADDQYIWLVYGKQDHEVWVVKFDKKRLLKSLVLIPS